MAWDSILAKDFCKSVRDGTHDTPKQMEMGYKLVTSKCIHDGFIFPEEAYFISEKDYRAINERSLVEQWDVLMSMIGNGLGRSAVVKQKPDYAIKNLALFKVGDEYKAKWLHYYLSSPVGQGLIYNSLQGSGQPFISLNLLRNFAIPNPPYEAIKKIVSVLELYDNLIENNQKQIKLLEEAAQRLYKQWFIDLRYPGHETTPIVGGLPKGWGNVALGDVYGKIESGSRPKGGIDSSIRDGIVSVGAENVIGLGQYNYSSEKLVSHEFYENSKRGKVEDRDILVYKDGAYIGRTSLFQDEFPRKIMMVNEHVFLLNAKNPLYQYYLFFTLNRQEYFDKMQKLNKNSAQPGINQDALKSLVIIWPQDEIVMKFDNSVAPMVKKIFALAKQNYELSQSRDRLLPKLMNGEIEA